MDYLVVLENLRESLPQWITAALAFISEATLYVLPVVVAVFYWCIDKNFGESAMISLSLGNLASNFLKNIFCVYRPWVRDPRIHVAEAAKSGAGGYSFPSGHSAAAGAVYGSILERYGKKTWVKVFCIAMLILVPFSRMFLGCHTIWDVAFGMGLGLFSVTAGGPFARWADKSVKNALIFSALSLVLCAVLLAITEMKAYPMDLTAEGKLLVDPEDMKPSVYSAAGILCGWAVGWPLEKKLVDFDLPVSGKEAILRGVVGVAVFLVVFLCMKKIGAGLSRKADQFLRYFVLIFVLSVPYPAAFKVVSERKFKKKSEA